MPLRYGNLGMSGGGGIIMYAGEILLHPSLHVMKLVLNNLVEVGWINYVFEVTAKLVDFKSDS